MSSEPTPKRTRNSDAPKRQLLTGYIIYASEIRKQVIDKNPDQNFGDISRLVGLEWKNLPHDVRSKYDERALVHNRKIRERAQKELQAAALNGGKLPDGVNTPRLTKRKLAKLAKEQMRQHHLSIAGHEDSLSQSPGPQDQSLSFAQPPNSVQKQGSQHSQPQNGAIIKPPQTDSSTQTATVRFVEPAARKRLVYSDTFRKYIEGLKIPNKPALEVETNSKLPAEPLTDWLGPGVGRHESPEAALLALRDFMLQDAVTMRRSMQPYL